MDAGPPPPGGNQDRGPAMMEVMWIQTGFAIIIIAMRFTARFSIHKTSWDDWLMLMTLALFIASAILATLQNSVGGYRHVYYLSEDAVVKALEYNYILRATVILSYATGKASVGALILRLIGRQNMWQKWAVWVLIVFTAIVNILNMIFNFVQCNPVNANWDPRVKLHATCWDGRSQLKFAYFMCAENIWADAVLAIIPATFLAHLNLNRRRRINLSILLGLGSMATICGIVKTTELHTLSNANAHPDFTWDEYGLTAWSVAETFVIMVCGSIPALKPIWDRVFVKKQNSAYSDSQDSYRLRYIYPRRRQSCSCRRDGFECMHTTLASQVDEPGIRATTQIEVVSSPEIEKGAGQKIIPACY